MKPLWFSLSGIEQKYNWRIFIFCPFLLLFHLFIHFQTVSYFFQFLPFQVEEPISSSKPLQFPGSNEHVNRNETVKYWYSAQLSFNLYPSFFHFKWKKPISSSKPSQFPGSNEHVNSKTSCKILVFSTSFAGVSLVLRFTTSCKRKYYLPGIHTFSNFFNLYPSFFHFKWKKPISSRKPSQFLVSLPLEGTAIKCL